MPNDTPPARTRRDRLVETLLWLVVFLLASYVAGVRGWL